MSSEFTPRARRGVVHACVAAASLAAPVLVASLSSALAQTTQQLPEVTVESKKSKPKAKAKAAPAQTQSAGSVTPSAATGASLTVPNTAEAQAQLSNVPGSVTVVPDTAYKSSTPAVTHQGCARLRARRLRPAEVGRGLAPVHPRLGPVAQLPSAQHAALHGRHPDQHRRRLWRLPGDRPDGLPLRRGLQGGERAALRRQLTGRRHQFRDADGPRRQHRSAPAPTSAASASAVCRRAPAAPRVPSTTSSPARGRRRTASATTAGASATRASANLGYQLSPDVETRFYFNANDIMQRIPGA